MPRPTRREFLASSAALAAASLLPAQAPAAARLASDPLRPQFHLLPAGNWMNDPNGPIFWNGRYHMFFQSNPKAAVWGNMSWSHAVSPDMIHWNHLPLALEPTPGGPDSAGCFSGTAIAVGRRVYALYTGVVESTPDKVTLHDGNDTLRESQCLAWSDDPDLVHWTKLPAPVVPDPPPGLAVTGFRDPSPWAQEDGFYLTVGCGIARVGGCVLLYHSPDLRRWTYLHPLASGRWNGIHTPNPCDDGEMWECPDFFTLDGGHVLIYSTLGKVFWQSGTLDPATMLFHTARSGQLDLDAFYAPKTQLDARGRRILWGWIPERRPQAESSAAGWAGMMSLPRVLSLDADGTLRMRLLPGLATLRGRALPAESDESREGVLKRLPQATGEVHLTGNRGRDNSLRFATAQAELLQIDYHAASHSFSLDGSEFALHPSDAPDIHAFIDGSVLEVILGQRIGCTRRFYYPQPIAPDVLVHASGAKLEAWAIRAISANRLATSG